MATIAVQLIHSCGHDAHHRVPQLNPKEARALYDSLAEDVCPTCKGQEGQEGVVQPEAATPPVRVPRRNRSRQVKIRWGP